ncbi:MAG: ATPase/DNA packaging protein, partial [Promethearchaeota archaeon]
MSYYERYNNNKKDNPIVEEKTDNTNSNPYQIQVKQSNKEGLEQPQSVELDIFPKLPMGMLVVGKSGSGKTNAIVNMLTNNALLGDYFDIVYLFTDAKPDKELIKDLKLEKKYIITDFDEKKVLEIMDKAEKTIEQKGFKNSPKLLFIFDDILSNAKFLRSKTATKLATANRHFNISYIFASQYFKKLPPVLRTNARYYIIFPSSQAETIKMADELTPPRMSNKKFIEYLDHATKE